MKVTLFITFVLPMLLLLFLEEVAGAFSPDERLGATVAAGLKLEPVVLICLLFAAASAAVDMDGYFLVYN